MVSKLLPYKAWRRRFDPVPGRHVFKGLPDPEFVPSVPIQSGFSAVRLVANEMGRSRLRPVDRRLPVQSWQVYV